MSKKTLTVLCTAMVISVSLISGCQSDAENGALLGTAIGAGIGQLAGGDTEATLIGAAVGGGGGYILGNESDKKKSQEEMSQIRAEQNTKTVWITNSNGSKIPVKVVCQGPGYLGPRGEYYDHLPTANELQPVYGF